MNTPKIQCKILERTSLEGKTVFVIQQRHIMFRWWWVDAWVNCADPTIQCRFDTFEEAVDSLKYFDGSSRNSGEVYRNF